MNKRAKEAGVYEKISPHSLRATGITIYLGNGGSLEHAQTIAGHAAPRTTKLYDRTSDQVSLDEIEKIVIKRLFMSEKKKQLCVYCDTREADTRDHVIPRCLFTSPYPPNLITVPACKECNGEKSKDDDFLRDYLTVDFAGNLNPTADEIFQGKVRRSVTRNSSEVGRAVLANARPEPLHTKGGIYLGNVVFAPLEEVRFIQLFGRMIRGLFFHYTSEVIPSNYLIHAGRVMPWDFGSVFGSFNRLNFNRCGPLGNVFVGGCARIKEEPFSTWWLLTFYERVHFSVEVLHPDLEDIVKRAKV